MVPPRYASAARDRALEEAIHPFHQGGRFSREAMRPPGWHRAFRPAPSAVEEAVYAVHESSRFRFHDMTSPPAANSGASQQRNPLLGGQRRQPAKPTGAFDNLQGLHTAAQSVGGDGDHDGLPLEALWLPKRSLWRPLGKPGGSWCRTHPRPAPAVQSLLPAPPMVSAGRKKQGQTDARAIERPPEAPQSPAFSPQGPHGAPPRCRQGMSCPTGSLPNPAFRTLWPSPPHRHAAARSGPHGSDTARCRTAPLSPT